MDATPIETAMNRMGADARAAAAALARARPEQKQAALHAAAAAIVERRDTILAVNADEAAAAAARGAAPAFIDRMTLTPTRLQSVCDSLRAIADQPDPIGEVIETWARPNGLKIERVRVPIGVVGVIFESRPNVVVDAAAICIKAGSAAILRSGSDSLRSAAALFAPFSEAIASAGLPRAAAQLVETTDRAAVGAMLAGLDGALDLVIPRGGKSLVARVAAEARAPVLSHLDGVCHVYVDGSADLDKAIAVTVNAKMRRTGVCGAAETLLIDRPALARLLPPLATALRAAGCALRGDADICAQDPAIAPASAVDWPTEYLEAVLSIAAVDGVDGAVLHIARYGSGHTDAVIAEDASVAERFLAAVDSAIVMHNASTQFADGGEFGLGAEIGIATGKLHARGPVGARELTTFKNIVRGTGQVRPV